MVPLDPPGVETRAQPLDLAPIKRYLPPMGFWCHPWEKVIHQLIGEIERLRALAVDPAVPGEPTKVHEEKNDEEDLTRGDSHGR